MIKASELRVGKTLIDVDGRFVTPSHLTEESFSFIAGKTKQGQIIYNPYLSFTDERVKPILLTEEILLRIKGIKCKLLFEDDFDVNTGGVEQSIIKEYLLGNKVSLEYFVDVDDFDVLYKGVVVEYYDEKVIYLHELQNLYFALTGKELEINL